MNRWPIIGVLLVLIAIAIPTREALAHELCFGDKTPHCLKDPFSDYWEANGGLPVFGYPITAAADELNRDTNRTHLTQWVERNRLEDHPENQGTPYRILLGLLGKERLSQLGRDWAAEPRESGAKAGCLWFAETGHNVCNQAGNLGFKRYWESNGLAVPGLSAYARSLQLFGLPLTEPKMETNSSGDTVLTQWFERARFEWHPTNPDQFKVLLGRLGAEVRSAPSNPPTPAPPPVTPGTGTPTVEPTVTPTGTLPTVTATSTRTPTVTPTGTLTPSPSPTCSPYPYPIPSPAAERLTATPSRTPVRCP